MTYTTLRYYNATLANNSYDRSRRIADFKKRFRTHISRRRARQAVQTALRQFSSR